MSNRRNIQFGRPTDLITIDKTSHNRTFFENSDFLKSSPQPPQNLSVTSIGETTIDLDWDPPAFGTLDDYTVYVFNNTTGIQEQTIEGIVLSEAGVVGLTTDNEYEFWVVSVRDEVESEESNHVTATPTDVVAPSVPTGLAAIAGDTEVALDWDDNVEPDLAGYNVYVDGVAHAGNPYLVSNATITGLNNGQEYDFQVSAFDDAGNESPLSPVVSASPQSVSAPNTHALSFDGAGDYVFMNSYAGLTDFTIEAYIKPNNFNTGVNQAIGGQNYLAGGNGFGIYIDSAGVLTVQIRHTNGTVENVTSSVALSSNTFFHVAATYDATNDVLKLYLDGVEVGSLNTIDGYTFDTATPFVVGYRSYSGFPSGSSVNFEFAGIIDDVRLWNVVRTQTQIANNSDKVLVGSETGLIGYWAFNDGAGTSATDGVATNNGTINGAVYSTDVPFA